MDACDIAMQDAYKQYKMPELCYLDSIISVVDAKRMVDEFGKGGDLLNDFIDEDDIANLMSYNEALNNEFA